MKEKDAGRRDEGRGDELRLLADAMMRKPGKQSSVDEMILASRRRAVAYGRARGNV